jgi:hypothetical protein
MKVENIRATAKVAREFLRRCDAVLKTAEAESGWLSGSALTGALRRQSLELTRALTGMRKP